MSFFSNVLMAIVSAVDPALGFIASVIKWVSSEAQSGFIFVLDLVSSCISTGNVPGDFAKDVAMGTLADAVEIGNLSTASNQVIPRNNVALKCNHCNNYRTYYVKNDGDIICKDCFTKKVNRQINSYDKIYIYKNGIYQSHNGLKIQNSSLASQYENFSQQKFNNDFPSLSRQYQNFRRRS